MIHTIADISMLIFATLACGIVAVAVWRGAYDPD